LDHVLDLCSRFRICQALQQNDPTTLLYRRL
jgi:hypothetical protein